MKKIGKEEGPIPKLKKRFQRLASYRLHRLASISDRFVELRYRRKFGLRTPEVGIMAAVGGSRPLSIKITRLDNPLTESKGPHGVAQVLQQGHLKTTTHTSPPHWFC